LQKFVHFLPPCFYLKAGKKPLLVWIIMEKIKKSIYLKFKIAPWGAATQLFSCLNFELLFGLSRFFQRLGNTPGFFPDENPSSQVRSIAILGYII